MENEKCGEWDWKIVCLIAGADAEHLIPNSGL